MSSSNPASATESASAATSSNRLIVVSNRLPVTIRADASAPGGYTFTLSSGGLVSALSGCKKRMSFTWIGWPGLSVDSPTARNYITKKLLEEYSCKPVWLNDDLADRHYNGFSNSILWPLFHYHPGEMEFVEENWLAYREANLQFAKVVRSQVAEGDMVWVQDYHLMLLPLMLRTLIEGSELQGETSQRELEHVRNGLDGTSQLPNSTGLAVPPNSQNPNSSNSSSMILSPPNSDSVNHTTGIPSSTTTTSANAGVGNKQELLHSSSIDTAENERDIDQRTRRVDNENHSESMQENEEGEVLEIGKGQGTGFGGAKNRGAIKIGFFLHTPFPSSEIYRILPVRREILLGILHCDLLGFHTYDYARHFLSSCTRILGLPTMPNGCEFEGRYVHVGTYPIGIEPGQFQEALLKESVKKRIGALERRFEGVKIIVGVDRLDYIKGVPQKLHALECFLTDHPEWIGKVVLVQVAVPSRQDVEEYQNLRASVNEAVGRINGRFGTVESMPIHFLHRSVGFEELCALYAVSDACLVTSTRDGMNLVSYEYIACQKQRHGSMILSEFAGAAQSLNGSLIVNPWDKFAVSDAIHEALTADEKTRADNFEKMDGYVSKHTASWWGTSFVDDLRRIQVGNYGIMNA